MNLSATIKPIIGVVLIAALTGCASAPPTKFANPYGTYAIAELEPVLRDRKPKPETLGYAMPRIGMGTRVITDFYQQKSEGFASVPAENMVAVLAQDPKNKDGTLAIPIQYVVELRETGTRNNPSVTAKTKLTNLVGSELILRADDSLLHHFTPYGEYVGQAPTLQTTLIESSKGGEISGTRSGRNIFLRESIYGPVHFKSAEDFQGSLVDAKDAQRRKENLKKERSLMLERKRGQALSRAVSAKKVVGRQVCTSGNLIGVVERVANDRVKISIVGQARGLTKNALILGDVPNFMVDQSDEGKMRWMRGTDLSKCSVDIGR